MRVRYSEPEYVFPGEWMYLSFNYTDYRYKFSVAYSDTTTAIASFPDQSYTLLPSQHFGERREEGEGWRDSGREERGERVSERWMSLVLS